MTLKFDIEHLPSPCYIIDEDLLLKNLELLQSIQNYTECKIFLALKSFATWSTFPMVKRYLAGTAASSLYEARLGREEIGKELHVYSPAYKTSEFEQLVELADCIIFNSVEQWKKFRPTVQNSRKQISCGLRVNHGYSEVEIEIYNPARKGSRLGTPLEHIQEEDLEGLSGFHFHSLCEQNSDVLSRTLEIFEQKFSPFLKLLKWVNFGGGHYITAPNYNVSLLCDLIVDFKNKYDLDVYLEPGAAVVFNSGFLIATVLDVFSNETNIAILDTSATAHMPDVLEMPYRPHIIGSALPGKKAFTYRLGGTTCLAGDVIGDYSFDKPLAIGDRLIFTDMAQYTMVKTTMFNGLQHPAIAIKKAGTQEVKVIRNFDYEDYKSRLS
ncbi:carboxynorspermidine decarboxylase [Myxosarcina sp. GI1]|uniref:carboxynorspermidine decarboxylase n=1 Tax=Myxosarcina sp. GI1 TaxID=1541065 RepID=UPI000565BF6D|nr:carboxynorspermidine decarboxylase [Myxosarcina sp. GI1]